MLLAIGDLVFSATAKVHAEIAEFSFLGCMNVLATFFADFLLSLLAHLILANSTVIIVVLGFLDLASFTCEFSLL